MKRIMVLCLVMALLATMTIGVSATTIEEKEYVATANKFTVEINVGADNNGKMFGFVAVPKGAAIAEANIVYIDQATAADGKIVFTDFAPKGVAASDPTFAECDLYIGGGDLNAATKAGILKAAAQNNPITISGTITDTFSSRVATITVLNGETVVGTTTANVADGTYSVEVEAGTYSVKCDKDAYLPFTYTNVEVGEDSVEVNFDMTALAGDVNDNSEVNVYDLDTLLVDYNKTANLAEERSDLNQNGEVNVYDLDALLAVYNQSAKVEVFASAAN